MGDETDMYLGLWALSLFDVNICGERLSERYAQACADGVEDTKLALRTFARLRETRTLAMRPIWVRMLTEAVEDHSESLNVTLTAEVLALRSAAGLKNTKGLSVPADAALDLLLELERRLRDPKLKEETRTSQRRGLGLQNRFDAGELDRGQPGWSSVDVLLPIVGKLDYTGFPLWSKPTFRNPMRKYEP